VSIYELMHNENVTLYKVPSPLHLSCSQQWTTTNAWWLFHKFVCFFCYFM